MIEKFKDITFWFFSHPVLIGICTFLCAFLALLSYLDQHGSKSIESSFQEKSDCIKNPIQAMSKNEVLNLGKASRYLSGCYVNGCYTYQLKITELVETDISNQYLKGLDWYAGVSISDNKSSIPIYSTVIKTRSSGKSIDEAKAKSLVNLDDKVLVWMDSLNICNWEKYK